MSMNDLDQVLKAGTLLVLETGEYSDRSTMTPIRIVKDVTKRQLAEEFKAQWKHPEWDTEKCWRPSPYEFIDWVFASEYVEVIDASEVNNWHVGSYGDFEP